MESGWVGNTDVEVVPRVTLDEQARDVPHPWLVDAARTPILVLGAAKIPCDAPHGDEVIPAVGFLVVRLILEPRQDHVAVAIAIFCGGVSPEVFTYRESSVEWDVERRSRLWLRDPALVVEDPVVDDDLGDELVRPVPRRKEILRHDSGERGGALA